MARGTLNVGHTALTSETFGQCWQLDATGNWQGFKETDNGSIWTLEQTRDANEVNEITDITNSVGSSWAQPAYSPAGNMTTIPQGNDPTREYTATYDAWNRLVKLEEEVSSTLETVSTYTYDGRKFQIVQEEYTDGVLEVTKHQYYTDGWQNIEQRDDSNIAPTQQYVWGLRYIDDCLIRDRITSIAPLNERLYALQDANWSIDAIVDSTGELRERFTYSPYGKATSLDASFDATAPIELWTILYCGYKLEETSDLYYCRYRLLNVLLGQWTQRDPLVYIEGNNLYAYATGKPPINTDPFGTFCSTKTMTIACPASAQIDCIKQCAPYAGIKSLSCISTTTRCKIPCAGTVVWIQSSSRCVCQMKPRPVKCSIKARGVCPPGCGIFRAVGTC